MTTSDTLQKLDEILVRHPSLEIIRAMTGVVRIEFRTDRPFRRVAGIGKGLALAVADLHRQVFNKEDE